MFSNISNICEQTQSDQCVTTVVLLCAVFDYRATSFICPNTEVFFVASVVWGKFFLVTPSASLSAIPGVIGPKRQFSAGQIYQYVTCLVLFT